MKKRLMSKLLMGALVVLTMGVFSSCKDYDDDINATNTRIDKLVDDLQVQVDALKAAQVTCDNNFKAAKALADAAQATADDALAKAKAAQDAADAAQATGDDALAKAKQGIADAENARALAALAQAAAEEAKAAAEAARKEALEKIASEVEAMKTYVAANYVDNQTFADQVAKLATVDGLNAAIKKAEDELAGLKAIMENADSDINKKIDDLETALRAAINEKLDKKEFDAAYALVSAQITGINADIATLKAEDTRLADLIAANTTNISANAAAISKLQEQILQVEVNRKAIEALDKKVADLTTDLSDYKSAQAIIIAGMETKIAANTDAIAEQTTKLANFIVEINGKVDALTGRMTDAETAINELKTQANDLQTQINTTNNTVSDLLTALNEYKAEVNGKLTTLGANVQANTDNITDLLARMGAVETEAAKIAGILTEIDNLTTAIQTAQGDITTLQSTLDTKVGELNDAIGRVNAQAQQNKADIAANLDKITANTNDITTLKGQVSTLQRDLTNLTGRVTTLETNLAALTTKVNTLTLFVNKNLTSIVTKPSEWIYGLPKVDATIIAPQNVYELAVTPATAQTAYTEVFNPKRETEAYSFSVQAKYWMNPSTFDKSLYDYAFEELPTQAIITRAGEDESYDPAGTTIESTEYDGSVLTVNFRFNNPKYVNNAKTKFEEGRSPGYTGNQFTQDATGFDMWTPNYAWVTTLALKATRKTNADETAAGLDANRTITSDYCLVVPSYDTNLKLANNKYASTVNHNESNILWHLNTTYDNTVAEDNIGNYSFTLQRDKKIADGENVGFIDLDNRIDVHFTELGSNAEKIWTNAQARSKGFDFRYTIVPNGDESYFTQSQDGHKNIISVDETKGATAEAAGHVAIIRVELLANEEVYAYGYVSILITNTTVSTEIELPELVLDCDPTTTGANGFTTSTAWDNLIANIETALGQDFNPAYYEFVLDGTNLKKFGNEAATSNSNKRGSLKEDDANELLAWSFTLAEAKAAFYNGETPKNNVTPYYVWIRINPTDEGAKQGMQAIIVKVIIPSVKYPSGTFPTYLNNVESEANAMRLQQAWFGCQNKNIAASIAERYEVHANVEPVGQRSWDNTGDAADKFVYDISSAFLGNKFTIYPTNGFTFSEEAQVWFDYSKYTHYFGPGTAVEWNDSSYFFGASSAEYCLFLTGPKDLKLKAAKKQNNGSWDFSNAQVVVDLSMTHAWNLYNNIAEFQGYQDPVNGEFARDLLNHAGHTELAKGKTFTTHMILHQYNYCLPIREEGNNKFDIRWLRPVSAIASNNTVVYDARNDGNYIWVADLVNFIEWRNHRFSASNDRVIAPSGLNIDRTGYDYMKYYGVTTIKADFDYAKTNFNGGSLSDPDSWPLITALTSKMKFEPDANAKAINNGGTADANTGWTADYSGFRVANGYYLYENNSGVVGEFYIYLPVSVVYDWGETEPEWILIKVNSTEGQSRRR